MHCDVVSLVALDFILWIIRAGVVRIVLLIDISCMHLNDLAVDIPSFRVPGHVIADFEFSWHAGLHPVSVFLYGSADNAATEKEISWPATQPRLRSH